LRDKVKVILKDIKIISFDMEGTLIDHTYSKTIWEKDIPKLYAKKNDLDYCEAKRLVLSEYESVGDSRPEWYDVGYWFNRFGFDGDWRDLAERRSELVSAYSEVDGVLTRLSRLFPLIVCSNTIRDFLEVQLRGVGRYFMKVFSAPSDFYTVKKDNHFYEMVTTQLDIQPCELVHVGDNYKYDYLAAKELGLKAFYLDRSCQKRGPGIVCSLEEFEDALENP
jgi:FMN phosphatase YigB (HAD superfamily)